MQASYLSFMLTTHNVLKPHRLNEATSKALTAMKVGIPTADVETVKSKLLACVQDKSK